VPSNAEDPVPVVVQGEILKVCINLKTGVIRVSNKCDTKTERKTVLGGAGAQGVPGPVGPVGPQGERGFPGAVGATGTVSGLKSTTIKFFSPYSMGIEGCPRGFSSYDMDVVTSASLATTQAYVSGQIQRIVSGLNTTRDTLYQCTITVYGP